MNVRITRVVALLSMAASTLFVMPAANARHDDWRWRNRHRYHRDWDDRYRVRVYEDRYWVPSYRYNPRREVRTYRYYNPDRDYYRDRWYERDRWRSDDSWYDSPLRIRVDLD